MVYGRLNNSTETGVYIYIYKLFYLITISNYYMYTAFKLYVYKLLIKGDETMIIYESKMEVNILFKHQLFIISEIKRLIPVFIMS